VQSLPKEEEKIEDPVLILTAGSSNASCSLALNFALKAFQLTADIFSFIN
jgi:hypothetical protein